MRETDRVARITAEWERERPDLDVAPQAVFGRLHRLAARLTEELVDVYRRHGLSEGEFDVLATLRRAGAPYERSAGELADWTMITTGGMAKRLDRLEADGLITRRPRAEDGRGRVVSLTARGLEVIDAAFTDHIANEQRLLDLVAPRDRRVLERILREWLAHFE
ncbi:MarR family winged helix-turn-helix transcriptional regulator [Leifsonia sp. AG29]|uniref:MarR family winged helix-turn-helix transcriptional regulator n=1 Tax=Leifsonia sp. AG29 TaxID=2598860 RepID=UPI00131C177A|nr:MarR family transcriptional regulator [Leifsonia sp. AG29]